MKTLRGLLESLVKSGAWGSLQESSPKMFRQARRHQKGREDENAAIRLAQEIRTGQLARDKRNQEVRDNKAARAAAAEIAAARQEAHAKRHRETLDLLKGLQHGDVGSVIIRDKKTGKPGEEHHIVNHQGSFYLVGPRGNTRQISPQFASVVNGAVNLMSIPKGRGNAKVIAQIEASARKGGVEGIDPTREKPNKYSYAILPGGKFVIKSNIRGG